MPAGIMIVAEVDAVHRFILKYLYENKTRNSFSRKLFCVPREKPLRKKCSLKQHTHRLVKIGPKNVTLLRKEKFYMKKWPIPVYFLFLKKRKSSTKIIALIKIKSLLYIIKYSKVLYISPFCSIVFYGIVSCVSRQFWHMVLTTLNICFLEKPSNGYKISFSMYLDCPIFRVFSI